MFKASDYVATQKLEFAMENGQNLSDQDADFLLKLSEWQSPSDSETHGVRLYCSGEVFSGALRISQLPADKIDDIVQLAIAMMQFKGMKPKLVRMCGCNLAALCRDKRALPYVEQFKNESTDKHFIEAANNALSQIAKQN